jgi:hypothetical protein
MANCLEILKRDPSGGRDDLKLSDCLKSISSAQVQDGQTCSFWQDTWLRQPLKDDYPELYSFAKVKTIFVYRFYTEDHIPRQFRLPLSDIIAYNYNQLIEAVQSIMQCFPLTTYKNILNYSWGTFWALWAYSSLLGQRQVHQAFKWIWDLKKQKYAARIL